MNISEIKIDDFMGSIYAQHVYNSPDFISLNRGKCDSVTVLLFNDGRHRFLLPFGVIGRKGYSPFSAPFGGIIPESASFKSIHFRACAVALKDYIRGKNFEEFNISFAPTCYDLPFFDMMAVSLLNNGFVLKSLDINHHINLTIHEHELISRLSVSAKKQLRQAIESDLTFEVVENEIDIIAAYEIIAQNRREKGYTLSMSLSEVLKTLTVVRSYVLVVRDSEKAPVAAAICFQVTESIVQVIYWGAIQAASNLRPMNFLAFKCFMFFANLGFRLVDIGPSAKRGEINDGLADFKMGIGCDTSLKFNLSFNDSVETRCLESSFK